MNKALWLLQVVLAAIFLAHGSFFAMPPESMLALLNAQIPSALRVFIGLAELLAAVGLIAPALTRILPGLTALAAAGLMLVVGSATVFHAFRGEWSSAGTTAILLLLTAGVAYLRWKVRPITPRAARTKAALTSS
jgi:hypothetical protein